MIPKLVKYYLAVLVKTNVLSCGEWHSETCQRGCYPALSCIVTESNKAEMEKLAILMRELSKLVPTEMVYVAIAVS